MAPVWILLAGCGVGLLLAVPPARWWALRARRDADRAVSTVLAATPAALLEVDLEGATVGRVSTASPAAVLLLGDDVVGRPLRDVLSFDDRHRVDQLLAGPADPAAIKHCALTVLATRGARPSSAVALVTQRVDRGRVLDLLLMPVPDQAQATDLHDPVTGLAVRPLLLEHLTYALAARDRGRGEVAVLHVDCGLDEGQVGLVADVAGRLRRSVRMSDPLARVDDDQFAVLCTDLDDASGAQAVAQRLEGALGVPFELDGGSVQLSAAVGVGVGQPHQAPVDLMADAPQAARDERARRYSTG